MWVYSDGGPLIVTELEVAPYWFGIKGNSGPDAPIGPVEAEDEIFTGTDYARTATVKDYVGIVTIVDGESRHRDALILNDDPVVTRWFEPNESRKIGMFVRIRCSNFLTREEDEAAIHHIENFDSLKWSDQGVVFHTSSTKCRLFDSAGSGSKVTEFQDFELPPGQYNIKMAFYILEDESTYILHGFVPVDEK